MVLAVVVVLAFAWHVMNGEERRRVTSALVRLGVAATRLTTSATPEDVEFQQALRARTRWVFVTPLLVIMNAAIYIAMAWENGLAAGSDTLIERGANFGPRTTNGEWWRLVSSAFVHEGPLHLSATLAGLLQAGLLLERLAGPLAFGAAYFAAALISGLVSLAQHPTDVTAGASGAVLGVYGLLVATSLFGLVREAPLTIPFSTLRRLLPGAALFAVYNAVTAALPGNAEVLGFVTGVGAGILLARWLGDAKPPACRAAIALATAVVIVVFSAVPLRGLTDIGPTLHSVLRLEEQTAAAYSEAVGRFRRGRIESAELASLIDREIIPRFRAARSEFQQLSRVPDEHKPLVADADAYLRLRSDGWRVRSEALHARNTKRLTEAEHLDRLARIELEKIRAKVK